MPLRSCSWCGHINPDNTRFCATCGHEAHVPRMYCRMIEMPAPPEATKERQL